MTDGLLYVASSWRNPLYDGVLACLQVAGIPHYDFKHPAPGNDGFHWREIDPHWQQWSPRAYRDALAHPWAQHGFTCDMDALKACTRLLLVLPCGRSAHLELGHAIGAGKETIIYMPEEGPFETDVPIMSIPLTKGYTAIIDERDGYLAAHQWHAHPTRHTVYAARSVGPHGQQKTILLHRAILQAPVGMEVDHWDGNGLNNRRSNLRLATRAQHSTNNHTVVGAVPFRGVFTDKKTPGIWRAGIRHQGVRTSLGNFTSAEEAARAYDEAALRLHGPCAKVNFPRPQPTITPELMYKAATHLCVTMGEVLECLGVPH